MTNDTIGAYYERPDGVIVLAVGFNNPDKVFYHKDGEETMTVFDEEFQTWKIRRDLSDFPNPIDPRLPYAFDLHWDIKYLSQLKASLESYQDRLEDHQRAVLECAADQTQMKALIAEYGIDLNYEQEETE